MPNLFARRLGALSLTLALLVPGADALSGVSHWAIDDVEAASDAGLAPESLDQAEATAPITRAEFCTIALNLYERVTAEDVKITKKIYFDDCDDPAVNTAYKMNLVGGRGNGKFDPDASIERQDICVLLENVLDTAGMRAPAIAGDAVLEDYPDAEDIKAYATDAMITMVDYSIVGGVATASGSTRLKPRGTATREQALIMANRFLNTFENSPRPDYDDEAFEEEEEEDVINNNDTYFEIETDPNKLTELYSGAAFLIPQSDAEKMALVYGAGGSTYSSAEEAEANMTEIAVKVWRLQSDGSKTTGTAYLTVNRNLASIYIAVFEEIYNGAERFPIKDAGCYAWRTGEHSQGTAIDLNWDENMEATINADGSLTPTTGTLWEPGSNPYSIPEGGDVYNAFTKYGFAWGGNAWSRKRDYMHFSYFGR